MHLKRFKFSKFTGGGMPPDRLSGMGSHVSYWMATNRILTKSLFHTFPNTKRELKIKRTVEYFCEIRGVWKT